MWCQSACSVQSSARHRLLIWRIVLLGYKEPASGIRPGKIRREGRSQRFHERLSVEASNFLGFRKAVSKDCNESNDGHGYEASGAGRDCCKMKNRHRGARQYLQDYTDRLESNLCGCGVFGASHPQTADATIAVWPRPRQWCGHYGWPKILVVNGGWWMVKMVDDGHGGQPVQPYERQTSLGGCTIPVTAKRRA